MAHGTEQHLEHAEHAQHHAHDPFDRRVAMSMAIIAACLAAVAMVSHRGHTETLRLQSEGNIYHTKASDMWNYYQAKNLSSRLAQGLLKQSSYVAPQQVKEAEYQAAQNDWKKQIKKYEGEEGKPGQLEKLKKEAEDLVKQGEARQEKSHQVHESINWVDYGQLALELGLVLCSIAVLSKQRSFWLGGLVAGVLGLSLALFGVYHLYSPHHDAEHGASHQAAEPHQGGSPKSQH